MEDYPFHGSEAPHTAAYLWPPVVRLLRTRSPDFEPIHRVVDVGVGNGAFAARLAELGYQVTAVEPSASGIAAMRAAHGAVESVRASAYDDLSAWHGSFDAAVALEVVEHCYYPRRLAGTLAALVRPGGMVALLEGSGLMVEETLRVGRLPPLAKSMVLAARRPAPASRPRP